jgi:hypothetical protein
MTRTHVYRGRTAAAVAMLLAVSACSSSGGGGSPAGKGLTASPTSLSFSASRLVTSVSKALTVTIGDPAVAYVVVGYPPGTAAPSWLDVSVGSEGNPTVLSVDVQPGGLPVGTYRSTLRVAGLRSDHSSVVGYVDVPITFEVTPAQVIATPDHLAFEQAVGGAAPQAQSLALAASGDTYAWNATVEYTTGSGWLRLAGGSSASGATLPASLPVSVQDTSSLAVGQYAATIRISGGGEPRSVPVTLQVRPSRPAISPAPLSFSIDPSTTPAELTRTVTVGATGAPITWTATSSVPWVSVSPASGASGTDVQIAVEASALEELPNGTHAVTLTFAAGVDVSTPVNVSIDLELPRVAQVAPYVAYTGQAKPVIVRGAGFGRVPAPVVEFGGSAGAGVSVLTDMELQVTPPADLAVGRHRVRLRNGNALGLDRSSAELVVVAAEPHTAGLISNALTRTRLVYDAERRCLYAASPAGNVIQRFCDSGAGWTQSILAVNGVRDVALTPDGKQLVAISTDRLHRVDLASFAVVESRTGEQLGLGWYDKDKLTSVVVTNDAQAMVLVGSGWYQLYRYDLVAGGALHYVSNYSVYGASAPHDLAVSLNGDRILSGDAGSSPANFAVYDATDRTVTTPSAQVVYYVTLDRTGSRIGAAGLVYDGSFVSLGYAENWRMTVNPDGTRAYGLDPNLGYPPTPAGPPIVHTFDITGSSVVELGTTSLSPSPGASSGNPNLMVVSLDGGTLFVEGPSGISVLPAP